MRFTKIMLNKQISARIMNSKKNCCSFLIASKIKLCYVVLHNAVLRKQENFITTTYVFIISFVCIMKLKIRMSRKCRQNFI